MNVSEYLSRINSSNFKESTVQGLYRLQQNHLLNIPFENLDIHLGKSIETELDKIYEKIIINRRGGICCELNYLFSWLLKQLGFLVNILSCQIKKNNFFDEWTPWDSHFVLMVQMNESSFLVDVGFTQNFRSPLKFVIDQIQQDVTGCYKISKEETNNVYILYKCLNFDHTKNDLNEWIPVYRFNTEARPINELKNMMKKVTIDTDYFSFHNRSVCVIHTTYTILNLVGYRLSEIKFSNSAKKSTTHSVLTKTEVFDAIKNIYGISLAENEIFEPKGD